MAQHGLISGSRAVVPGTIADGTTLGATHIGRSILINGGTINLPPDVNWPLYAEIEFQVVGTNATTFQWAGNSIITADSGAATIQVVAGIVCSAGIFKKTAAGIAQLFIGVQSLNALTDVTLVTPGLDDILRYSGTQFINAPEIFSLSDPWNRALILPASGATLTQLGITLTAVGTIAHPQPVAGTVYTEAHRYTLSSAATAGALTTLRSSIQRLWRGNAPGKGGFKISMLFGLAVMQAGQRGFFGVDTSAAAAANVDPLTATTSGKVGVAFNANTGNWNLINNIAGTAPTVLALGAGYPLDVTTWYELKLWSLPNDLGINYRVINKTTGAVTSGLLTTNIPANTSFMNFYSWMTNNATAAVAASAHGKINMEFG
jgi:hypothetical protein